MNSACAVERHIAQKLRRVVTNLRPDQGAELPSGWVGLDSAHMKRHMLAFSLLGALPILAASDDYPHIGFAELKKAIAEKSVVLLDVNGTDSWKSGHIPGALNFEGIADRLAKVLPQDKHTLVVAYCGGPTCNAYREGAAAARKLGYTNVRHFTGGISGWKKAGEPTEAAE